MALEAPLNIKVIGKKLVLDELLGPYDGNSSGKVGFFYFSKSGTPYCAYINSHQSLVCSIDMMIYISVSQYKIGSSIH